MITEEDLLLALDESVTEEALEAALAHQRPMRWGPASPELLEAYARKPVLQRGEAVALLQGLIPPAPEFGDDKVYFLDEYADVVGRFLSDCDAGRLPMPCRPVELRAWAIGIGAWLPPGFSEAVPGNSGELRGEVAAPPTPVSKMRTSERVGDTGHDPRLQHQAEQVASELLAKRNRQPTKTEVAEVVSERTGRRQSPDRIKRLIRNTWDPTGRGQRRKPNRSARPRLNVM